MLAVKRFLKKLPKVLFLLCFLPYLFLAGAGIYYAFFGWEEFVLFSTREPQIFYGIEAFCQSALFWLYFLWYLWVIPACLIYQAIYLAVKFYLWVKKKNSE